MKMALVISGEPEKKCSQIKCGAEGRCVGFEGDKIYCYGSFSTCMKNTCETDQDCQKYSTNSPKFSSGEPRTCTTPATNHLKAACTCGKYFTNSPKYGSCEPTICTTRAINRMEAVITCGFL